MGNFLFLAVAAAKTMAENEPAVGTVVITGISIVFGVLVLLYLLITLEGVIFTAIDNKKKGIKPEKKAPVATVKPAQSAAPAPVAKAAVIEQGISGEIIAAISAAVAAMEGGSRYTIRSLSRVKQGRSAWGGAGVASNTEPF